MLKLRSTVALLTTFLLLIGLRSPHQAHNEAGYCLSTITPDDYRSRTIPLGLLTAFFHHRVCMRIRLKNVNTYLFLSEYSFLDLIFFLVNHFRFLNHAAPCSLMARTLMNQNVLNTYLFLHLLHLRSYFQNSSSCFIGVSKYLATIKALGLRPRAFICFSVFGYPNETLALVLEIVHANLRQFC